MNSEQHQVLIFHSLVLNVFITFEHLLIKAQYDYVTHFDELF